MTIEQDPRTFTLPADPKAADTMATELGEIATATEWKRAAIVYARVRVQGTQGRPVETEKVKTDLLTPAEYALLGIHGLRSKTTIRAYWRAWDNAVTEGAAQAVSLGDTVELPDAEWADYYSRATPATPPYYRPLPSTDNAEEDQRPYDDEFDFGYGLELLRNRTTEPNDGASLGLGACPPLASDPDDQRLQHRPRPTIREPRDNSAVSLLQMMHKFSKLVLVKTLEQGHLDDTEEALRYIADTRTALDAIERAALAGAERPS